jgi:hypothetical protein
VTLIDHVLVFEQKGPPGHLRFHKVEDYDLSDRVISEEFPYDNLQTVMPDFQGWLWFVVRHSGLVGVLDPDTGAVGSLRLGEDDEENADSFEEIANSFPMIEVDADVSDAFVVTTKAMYRLRAGLDGVPHIKWRSEYKNFGGQKPGQLSPGSGTSPTLLDGGKYVAITDNDDQMHIVVYRTAVDLGPNEERVVCEVPVFEPGAGACEDSLIGPLADRYRTNTPIPTGEQRRESPASTSRSQTISDLGEWRLAAPQVRPNVFTDWARVFLHEKYDETGLDVCWTAGLPHRGDRLGAADRHRIEIRQLCAGANDRTYRRAVRGRKRWVYLDAGHLLIPVTVVLAE